jgi:diguanylate cyclase (GGDEF)-like protein
VLRQNSTTIQHAEQIIFGIDHTRVGKHVIQKWGLPDFFVTPIRYHHEPDMVSTTSFKEHVLAQILHLSSLFIDIFDSNNVDSTLASINQYKINCSFASFFEPSEITQAIIKEVQSIFPIFEIEVTDSELLRISESARGHLHGLSNEMIEKISIQDQDIEQLKLHSITDELTNLYNQRHFSKTLEHEIERAKRHKTALSLIMADIDEFKAINDFFGHLAGDYALKTVAGILKRAIRGSDYVFRYGGDEFAAILPSTSSSEAQQVAERLRKMVRENPITYNDKTFMMTISFGIASLDLKSSADLERFIHKADMALYEAKKNGRDRSFFYNKADFDTSKPIILIVDDEEVVLITLSKMLERLGYRVVEASERSKAMSLIDQYADQLNTAILDVMMPGDSSNDVLARLRRSCNGVRVFLSSGYPSDRIEQELIRNCDGFLTKPYTLGDLSLKLLGVKHSNQRPDLAYSRTEPLTA